MLRGVASKVMWVGRASRATLYALGVVGAVMAALMIGALTARVAHAETFTVTNTSASGDGSLDQQITNANDNNNATTIDTINFNIPGTDANCASGVCTISPSSALPEITEPVIINGYSQGKATTNTTADDAKSNTLAVGNDAVLKIELSGASIPTGTLANGLKIKADNSTIRGLIISKWENGIFLDTDADGNMVRGNFIGTDTAGNHLGNNIGVAILGANNTIGGTTPATRNIISANTGYGVQIGSATGGNIVQGNYIGTDKNGTAALGNNLGVVIDAAPNNTIGGTTAAERNVISGNAVYGVRIAFDGATGNKVQGNYIGANAMGKRTLGNGIGVSIQDGAANNLVGGAVTDTSNPRNLISGNGNNGVEVIGRTNDTSGNDILSNAIYANGALGIDLINPNDPAGVTPNDEDPPPDSDTGANTLQNFPDLISARTGLRATTIRGTLTSTASTATTIQTFTIQFFSSPKADPSGNGEGRRFLGQMSVSTDMSGNTGTFTFRTENKVPAGQVVTATATSSSGGTSEFSNACTVQ